MAVLSTLKKCDAGYHFCRKEKKKAFFLESSYLLFLLRVLLSPEESPDGDFHSACLPCCTKSAQTS
ncbi:hypothetical protein FH972_010187 [Carpinus fangiana]|uniref:Uncharacterized protein n=1 Tax=Carpinus fangiana TaxID=176857 RepID=A0A660KMK4_9ROSI|nr:hypothetical protein FH972_010187 [Carpinus fangiana]